MLLQESTSLWDAPYFLSIVDSGVVPADWLQDVLNYIMGDPEMIGLTDTDFFEAARLARPDLYAILVTANGRTWIQSAMSRLTAAVPGYLLKRLLGGSR